VPKSPVFAVTQALSSEFYFPTWYGYYSEQIGSENLFIVTDKLTKGAFDGLALGGVYAYPSDVYDEVSRIRLVTAIVSGLLEFYDTAVVADTDEFLVPDPRFYSGILDYLRKSPPLYSTSIGVDVIQYTDEADLDLAKPILLRQRKYGYLTTSLCKTSLTRIPMEWGVGYHYCSVYPKLNGTFLFHLKRADKNLQFRWLERMSKYNIPTEQIRNYYAPEQTKIDGYYSMVRSWPVKSGWENAYDKPFIEKYFNEVCLDRSGIYRGKHFSSNSLFEFPEEFSGKF
jgi:hypothetical protein